MCGLESDGVLANMLCQPCSVNSVVIQLPSRPQVLVIVIHINRFTITWEVNSTFPRQFIIHSFFDLQNNVSCQLFSTDFTKSVVSGGLYTFLSLK